MAAESLHQYIVKGNSKFNVCVDEREHSPYWFFLQNLLHRNEAPTKLPGAVATYVDYLRKYKHFTEQEAWKILISSGIRLVAHKGPDHSTHDHDSPYGCGWNMLTELFPNRIALEHSAEAANRVEIVKANKGLVYTVFGDHVIDEAFKNYNTGTTLDVDAARKKGIGILWCDIWAVGDSISQINNKTGVRLNISDVQNFVEHSFELVTDALTSGNCRPGAYRANIVGAR